MARRISVDLVGDASSLERSFKRAGNSAKGFERTIGHASRGAVVGSGAFKSLGRSIAFASAGFLGGVGIAALAKSVVSAASTIQEETEKTGVVFGQSAKEVQAWAGTLASSFGVGEGAALQSAGTFGNMFRSLHIGEGQAAGMSKRLVELAADMASFNNASPEDTLKALSSGLAGQVRPLRQFGVFLSQDRIKQEALSSGIAKNASHLTAMQKVQAAYNIILKDTSLQHGDVARNTESLSVAQSKLKANLEDSQAIIGKALLPSLVSLASRLGAYLQRANETGQLQREVNKDVRIASQVVGTLADVFRTLKSVLEPVVENLGGVKRALILVGTAYVGLKVVRMATEVRALAAAWGLVGKKAEFAAAAQAGTGTLPGGLIGAGVAGAALAFGQRGETSVKVKGVQVGAGGMLAYQDPITGKWVMLSGFKGGDPLTFAERDMRRRHPELKRSARTGEDVSHRGAASRTNVAVSGGGGVHDKPGPLGFNARMTKLDIAFAKAQMTATMKDDRAVLQQQAALIRQRLTKVKSLKDRSTLYQQLASVESQIDQIDKDRNAKRQKAEEDRRAKELKERQKRIEAAKRFQQKINAAEAKLKDVMANVHAAFVGALDNARSEIGDLFQGPVLNATDLQKKMLLGVPAPSASSLTKDLLAQTRQGKRLENDLRKLGRQATAAGVSKADRNQLVREMRAKGTAGLPQLEALTGAKAGERATFFAAFAGRERFAHRVAQMTVQARTVHISTSKVPIHVTVNLDGRVVGKVVTKHQDRDKAKTASQTRGRHGGR